MTLLQEISKVVLIGCGATLIMDVWLLLLKQLGVQTLNFAFIGRWIGHLFRGRFAHVSIAKAEQIRGELLLGWLTHYAVGVAFAAMLVGICGLAWTTAPSWRPAVLFGVGTVVIPLFVMQPAMGAGVASSKTTAPLQNCVRSLANHAVFGLGLYLSAAFVAWSF